MGGTQTAFFTDHLIVTIQAERGAGFCGQRRMIAGMNSMTGHTYSLAERVVGNGTLKDINHFLVTAKAELACFTLLLEQPLALGPVGLVARGALSVNKWPMEAVLAHLAFRAVMAGET